MLEALEKLETRSFQLSVVGKEKYPMRFYEHVKRLGIEENVKFFGQTKEVKTFYSIADCLVVASRYDPFANVTIEALAMGVYVISSSANGGSEILTKERGLVFDDLHVPDELLGCLEQAIKEPKTYEKATAIRNSVKEYDFSCQIGKIVDVVG